MKSLSLSTPHLIVMVGLPGAGKSCFANKFAETFKAPLVSEESYQKLVDADISVQRDSAKRVALSVLPEVLKTKTTVIFDGSAGMRSERAEIARLAKQAGYKPLFVWVQTDTATTKQRALKPSRANNHNPLPADIYENLVKKFSPPHTTENYLVLSGKHTYSTQAKVLLKKLVEPRAASPVTPTSRPASPNRIKIS